MQSNYQGRTAIATNKPQRMLQGTQSRPTEWQYNQSRARSTGGHSQVAPAYGPAKMAAPARPKSTHGPTHQPTNQAQLSKVNYCSLGPQIKKSSGTNGPQIIVGNKQRTGGRETPLQKLQGTMPKHMATNLESSHCSNGNSSQLKLQKNSKTILNRQQHIQSRERSHSGHSAQSGHSVATNAAGTKYFHGSGLQQQVMTKQLERGLDRQQFAEFQTNNENLNMQNLPSSSNLQNGKMQLLKPTSTRNLHQQLRVVEDTHRHDKNNLVRVPRPSDSLYSQPNQHKIQLESEIQSEPFEAIKSPVKAVMDHHAGEGDQKMNVIGINYNQMNESSLDREPRAKLPSNDMSDQFEQVRMFNLDESQNVESKGPFEIQCSSNLMEPRMMYSSNQEKVENIVGPYGYSTSTFGCKHRRLDSKGNPNNGELRIEETLGISSQVQQMISTRPIDCHDQGKVPHGGLDEVQRPSLLVNDRSRQASGNAVTQLEDCELGEEQSISDSLNQDQHPMPWQEERHAHRSQQKAVRSKEQIIGEAKELLLSSQNDIKNEAFSGCQRQQFRPQIKSSISSNVPVQRLAQAKNQENTSSVKKLKIRTSDKLNGGSNNTNTSALGRQATNANLQQMRKFCLQQQPKNSKSGQLIIKKPTSRQDTRGCSPSNHQLSNQKRGVGQMISQHTRNSVVSKQTSTNKHTASNNQIKIKLNLKHGQHNLANKVDQYNGQATSRSSLSIQKAKIKQSQQGVGYTKHSDDTSHQKPMAFKSSRKSSQNDQQSKTTRQVSHSKLRVSKDSSNVVARHNSPIHGICNLSSAVDASLNGLSSPSQCHNQQEAFTTKLHQVLLKHQQKQIASDANIESHMGDAKITSGRSEQIDSSVKKRPCHTSRGQAQNKSGSGGQLQQRLLQPNNSSQSLRQNSMITDSLEGTAQKDHNYQRQRERVTESAPGTSQPAVKMGIRQHVPHQQRAELILKLAKYIKVSNGSEAGLGDSMKAFAAQNTDAGLMDDVVQENLREFLRYLEQRQVININEIEKDRNKMDKLINEISQIDFSNFKEENFMRQYDAENGRADNEPAQHVKHQEPKKRAASDGSHHGFSGAFSGGGITSGADTSNCNNYNTSGAINFQRINGGADNKYLSTSSNKNGPASGFVASKQSGSSILNMNTTATSTRGRSGTWQRVSHQHVPQGSNGVGHKHKSGMGSLECQQRRKGTPVSIDGAQSRGSANESVQHYTHKYINSKERMRASNTSGFSGNSNDMNAVRDSKNCNSQTRLHTSSSRISNKYNTSGDQVMIQQNQPTCPSNTAQIHEVSSSSTPTPYRILDYHTAQQLCSQQQQAQHSGTSMHNVNTSNQSNKLISNAQGNHRCQQENQANEPQRGRGQQEPAAGQMNVQTHTYKSRADHSRYHQCNQSQHYQSGDPSQQSNCPQTHSRNQQDRVIAKEKPQVHNTTINLQINANVENLNITGQIKQAQAPTHPQGQRPMQQSNDLAHIQDQSRQSNLQRQSKNVSSEARVRTIFASNSVVSGGMRGLAEGAAQQKQKRGGSHEEHKDKMKLLLMMAPADAKKGMHQQLRNLSDNRAQAQDQLHHGGGHLIQDQNKRATHAHGQSQPGQQHCRPGDHQHYVSRQVNQLSRAATAQANMRAYGVNNAQPNYDRSGCHASGRGGPNNSLNRSRANGNSRSTTRSIHQKQQHLKTDQHQKLNEEIMLDRDKIIKYNRQYMRKYQKFPPTCLDFYKFVKKIGTGAFGQVYLAIHKLTGKFVAIKMIELSQLEHKYSKQKVFQEIYILKKIRHSNIIRLYEVFENKKHIMMVMEYAGGGDLYHLVKKSKHLTEDETKYIFKQIAQAVAHCHCRSVLHRDIKLDNILLDGEGGVKICDFGVSRLVNKNEIIQEQCGTPAYLAPEMSSNSEYTGFFVDIWSLGVLLYVMLQGTVPFRAKTMEGLHQAQMRMNLTFPVDISEEAQGLIKAMLQFRPEDRLSIPQILSNPWLKHILGPDGLPVEGQTEDEEDYHDFNMGLSFQRQECNLNPLSVNTQEGRGTAPNHGEITTRCQNATSSTLQQLGNINVINIENLFFNDDFNRESRKPNEGCKLSYMNYCAVTQDFNTYHIEEEALRVLESFGFARQHVINSLNQGELNHATCSYNLLVMD